MLRENDLPRDEYARTKILLRMFGKSDLKLDRSAWAERPCKPRRP